MVLLLSSPMFARATEKEAPAKAVVIERVVQSKDAAELVKVLSR